MKTGMKVLIVNGNVIKILGVINASSGTSSLKFKNSRNYSKDQLVRALLNKVGLCSGITMTILRCIRVKMIVVTQAKMINLVAQLWNFMKDLSIRNSSSKNKSHRKHTKKNH